MALEIEKKFLLKNNDWKRGAVGKRYRQGYLTRSDGCTVRVRVIEDRGFLTIKGPAVSGVKQEFEYEVPVEDAHEMLTTLSVSPLVEKDRYKIDFAGFIWEIDEFFGDNEGLVLAEIELEEVDQEFELPPWIGKEVTEDSRYYNACLAMNPYKKWKK